MKFVCVTKHCRFNRTLPTRYDRCNIRSTFYGACHFAEVHPDLPTDQVFQDDQKLLNISADTTGQAVKKPPIARRRYETKSLENRPGIVHQPNSGCK